MNKSAEITHNIITTYRKRLWSPFTKAIREYQLIDDGDAVAVCISGGKDSFLLALLLQELQRHSTIKFAIKYLCLDPGYSKESLALIEKDAQELGVELTYVPAVIFRYVETLKEKPCYMCARMRRGNLYQAARDLGCNKIALGHHYDDVIETILLSILYSGKTKTMLPKLYSQNFGGMGLIRPMYLIEEKDITTFWNRQGLEFIRCACSLTKGKDDPNYEEHSKRAEVKRIIDDYSKKNKFLKANLFKSVQDINVETIMSYKDNKGVLHKSWEENSAQPSTKKQ